MPQLGQGQTGSLKSTPKITRINGDDSMSLIYRNLGNNHAYPFIWTQTFTVASGITTVLMASGIKYHGFDLATYGKVITTPNWASGEFYVTKDTVLNTVTFTCTTSGIDAGTSKFDAIFMLGVDPVIEGINCRGTGSPMPNYP